MDGKTKLKSSTHFLRCAFLNFHFFQFLGPSSVKPNMAEQNHTGVLHCCMLCDPNDDSDKENKQPDRILHLHSKAGKENDLKGKVEYFLGATLTENPSHVICYNHSRRLDRWLAEVSIALKHIKPVLLNYGPFRFRFITETVKQTWPCDTQSPTRHRWSKIKGARIFTPIVALGAENAPPIALMLQLLSYCLHTILHVSEDPRVHNHVFIYAIAASLPHRRVIKFLRMRYTFCSQNPIKTMSHAGVAWFSWKWAWLLSVTSCKKPIKQCHMIF